MYKPHQIEASDKALDLLHEYRLAAIFGLPRTGKTRAAIRTAELYLPEGNFLVLTRKAAIPGWEKELEAVKPLGKYTVTNYEQVSKLDGDYDLLILDESHNLGARGKPTQRVKTIRALAYRLPLITLTGTPTIETPLSIYHQWCVTRYSPFNYHMNFYSFFREFGIPSPIWVNGRSVEQYKLAQEEKLQPIIERYAVRIDQDQAGIGYKAQDVVHTVELGSLARYMINNIMATGVSGEYEFDSDIGIRTAVHQIESGALLYQDELIMLGNNEVMDYLMETFGDTGEVAFMTHFRSTREKLRRRFKRAQLLSSMADAEGVDLSHLKAMVIVNTAYSGAKFTQLRERVTNMNRTDEAFVHHIVTNAGVSRDVYQAVSSKKDYNMRAFRSARAAK